MSRTTTLGFRTDTPTLANVQLPPLVIEAEPEQPAPKTSNALLLCSAFLGVAVIAGATLGILYLSGVFDDVSNELGSGSGSGFIMSPPPPLP
jgi:hypothetical protein